jgi:hypothetical protein
VTRPSVILALRAALRHALVADDALVAMLGGPRIYDEAPRGLAPPYVVFGDAVAEDWSAGDRTGARQTLSLVAWSDQGGDSEVLSILARLSAIIGAAILAPEGHALIGLRVLAEETARPRPDDPAAGLRRAILRLECLTQTA